MALDPSISLGVKPIQLEDPTNQLARALQIQSGLGQNRLQQLQFQQAQQSFDATNKVNNFLTDNPQLQGDPDALRAGLLRTGGSYALPVIKNLTDTQTAQANLKKLGLDNETTQIGLTARVVGAAAPQGPDAVKAAIGKLGFLDAGTKQDILAHLPNDPTQFADWVKEFQSRGLTAEQQFQRTDPKFFPTEQGIAAVRPDGSGGFMVPNITGQASSPSGQPGIGPGIPQGYAPPRDAATQAQMNAIDLRSLTAGAANAKTPEDRAAYLGAIAKLQQTGGSAQAAPGSPDAPSVVPVAQQAPSAAPTALGARPMRMTYHADPLTGQLIGLPESVPAGSPAAAGGPIPQANGGALSKADQAIADQIARYDIAPPSGMALRNPRMANIMAAVADQHPDFDATQFGAKQKAMKDFATGQQGNSLRSFAVATDHLDTLAQLTGALKNGDYPLINKLANIVSTQTGGTAPTNFDTAKDIVSKEVIKAIVGGGGGVSEREDLARRMSNASTPAQLLQQIDYYKTLMGAQRDALISQYENTTGRSDAATRFNFKSGAGPKTASPVPQSTVDALLQKYGPN